jgi:hypothetical protein
MAERIIQSRVVEWFHPDDSERPGVLEINDETYEYAPSPAADLAPNECTRIHLWKVKAKDDRRPLGNYTCRAFMDGRIECSCPDFQYRRKNTDQRCKHSANIGHFGIIRWPEAPAPLMEVPF